MDVPKNMSNDESKLIAGVVAAQRKVAIASFDLMAAKNKLERFGNGRL